MPVPPGVVKFTPGIKFIVAVYMTEIALGLLVAGWLMSRAAP